MGDVPKTDTLADAAVALCAAVKRCAPDGCGHLDEHLVQAQRRVLAALAAHDTPPPACNCEPPQAGYEPCERPAGHENQHRFVRSAPPSLGDVSDSEPPAEVDDYSFHRGYDLGHRHGREHHHKVAEAELLALSPDAQRSDPGAEEYGEGIAEFVMRDAPEPAEGGQPDVDDELLAEHEFLLGPEDSGYTATRDAWRRHAIALASALRRKTDSLTAARADIVGYQCLVKRLERELAEARSHGEVLYRGPWHPAVGRYPDPPIPDGTEVLVVLAPEEKQ